MTLVGIDLHAPHLQWQSRCSSRSVATAREPIPDRLHDAAVFGGAENENPNKRLSLRPRDEEDDAEEMIMLGRRDARVVFGEQFGI
ncbi:hypothetical protein JTE90_026001 [Oedothorax gibbosus]|uniref:Uncharacterized protein n=1 Tax=Oedothorax gibbosus TaxID=931172 RepID=A0AAV6UIZ8_9ARAC|nr:hypothetical protein JTE90_026001 [Oedothorax gibbosus]